MKVNIETKDIFVKKWKILENNVQKLDTRQIHKLNSKNEGGKNEQQGTGRNSANNL